MIPRYSRLVPAALACAAVTAAPAPAVPAGFECETGWRALGAGAATLSPERYKSGSDSLRWSWTGASDTLEFADAARFTKAPAGGFGFWIYNETPSPRVILAELRNGETVCGAFRLRLDFRGWRPVILSYAETGYKKGSKPGVLRLRAPAGPGRVYLDCARYDLSDKEIPGRPVPGTPENIVLTGDIEPSRPWLPPAKPATAITPSDRDALARLAQRLLPAVEKPRGGLTDAALADLRKHVAELRVKRVDGRVTGRAIAGVTTIRPDDAIDGWAYIKICDDVRRAYGKARNPAEAEELKRLFALLSEHLLDQGWVAGGETHPFINYPAGDTTCFAAMRDTLAEAGLDRDMALMLAWSFGSHGAGDWLAQEPFASMDGLGFWAEKLPSFLLMIPDEAERLHAMRLAKRFYDLALLNRHTIGPDGSCIHHGAFHFAYASYNLPRLIRTLGAMADTEFRLAAPAHERLRTYAHAIAFTLSAGEQPYNLGARAGTPLHGDMGRFATMLAELGSPENPSKYDAGMAALALSQYAELGEAGAKITAKPPYSTWLADGVKPELLTGHLVMNGGPIAVHRRPGWLVGIAGQGAFTRGLEIYGWTQANNYARFGRHGSVCVMSGGTPPSLAGSGWRYDGWNWSHFPGTTALRLPETDLFEGYTMSGNPDAFCGGTALGGDGVWAMNCPGISGITFKKTVFCFDDRITVATTGIASAANAPAVTTLFQNALRPGHAFVAIGGDEKPFEKGARTFSGDRDTWLLDNEGTGYLLPAGHDPVRLSCGTQQWTYMTKNYLRDPKTNPLPDLNAYRYWSRRGKDMAALERAYKPSEGDFALAYFDHGIRPKDTSCVYTMVIKTDVARMKALAAKPPVRLLRLDAHAHVALDTVSGTTACALYDTAGERGPDEPVLANDRPCLVMTRPDGAALAVSVADTDINNTKPVRLTLRGAWKPAPGDPAIASVAPDGDNTVIEVRHELYQPAVFRLERGR